jgi:hypothetical protein
MGIDSKGHSVKEKDIFDSLILRLQNGKTNIYIKKRLAMIAIMSLNLNEEYRKKITD